jgi:DNA-binding MarR family transcriptional regulator
MSARTLILSRLEHGGPATRTELRDELHINNATVLRAALELIEAGCVRVSPTHDRVNERGRRVQVLEVVP